MITIVDVCSSNLKIKNTYFKLYNFYFHDTSTNTYSYHQALVKGDINFKKNVYFRINSACMTSEVFGCSRCDCKWQLDEAIKTIARQKYGLITYHQSHEGRGFGLNEKLKSYNLMDNGHSSSEAYKLLGHDTDDIRDFEYSYKILEYFNINSIIIMGNNLKKYNFLLNKGIEIFNTIPLIYNGNDENIINYLKVKSLEKDHFSIRNEFTGV